MADGVAGGMAGVNLAPLRYSAFATDSRSQSGQQPAFPQALFRSASAADTATRIQTVQGQKAFTQNSRRKDDGDHRHRGMDADQKDAYSSESIGSHKKKEELSVLVKCWF